MSTSPSVSRQRHVEHTPPLHEYGISTPLRSPASSRLSLPFSMLNVRVAPSIVTLASHSSLPAAGAAGATCVCFGMLAAKRSILIFDSGNPRAFNAATTPVIEGEVASVSADRLVNEKSGTPYYLARVRVTEHGVHTLGERKLVPGMPADVLIITGQRTLLQYLMQPARNALAQSMIEE